MRHYACLKRNDLFSLHVSKNLSSEELVKHNLLLLNFIFGYNRAR